MRWIYSDPHFYHKNVIQYCSRPFENVECMNQAIIKNHNKIVNKNDKVFILGDISFAGKAATKAIISKLNGNITLIMGNHDKARTRLWWLDCGFSQVIEYPIILDNLFILSHEPVYLSPSMPYINIHGHLHGNILLNEITYKEVMDASLQTNMIDYNRYINVCLENTNFYPVNLNELIDKYKLMSQ